MLLLFWRTFSWFRPFLGRNATATRDLQHQPAVKTRSAMQGVTQGFTFVELMVVVSIIVLLISMAIPIYNKAIIRANETELKNNWFTLGTRLQNYAREKAAAPQSLEDLVSAGYLRGIPYDPMTRSHQTWRTILEDASLAVNQSEPGILDIKSGSDKTGLDGTPYSAW